DLLSAYRQLAKRQNTPSAPPLPLHRVVELPDAPRSTAPAEQRPAEMLTLSVVSDTHLEARPLDLDDVIDPGLSSDVLALLGDIGDPTTPAYGDFIAACASRFRTVLLLAGNNEYRNPTGRSMAQTEELIRARIAPYRNVRFLQNSIHIVNNICFIGSTLWSHVPNEPMLPPPQQQPQPQLAAAPPAQEAPRQAAPAPPHAPPPQPEAVAGPKARLARPLVSPFVARGAAAPDATGTAAAPDDQRSSSDGRHSGGGSRDSGDGTRSGIHPSLGRGHSASLPLYATTSLGCALSSGGNQDDSGNDGASGAADDDCGGRQRRSMDRHDHARRRCRPGCAHAHAPRHTVSLSALPPDAPCPPAFAEIPGSSIEESTSTSGSGSESGSGSASGGSGSGSDSDGEAAGAKDGGGGGGGAGVLLAGGGIAQRWAPHPAEAEKPAGTVAPSPIAAASAPSTTGAVAAPAAASTAGAVAAGAPAAHEPQNPPHHAPRPHHHSHSSPLARRSHGHHHRTSHPSASPSAAPAAAAHLTANPRDYLAATSLDYRLIYDRPGGDPITPETTNALFAANVAFLRSTVRAALSQGLQPVVLSHHAPALGGTSHPRFTGHPATHAYASDLEPFLTGSGILAWYCGHTHYNFDRVLQGGVRLASNQFGSQPQPAAGYSRTQRHHLPSAGVAEGQRATAEERAGSGALRAAAHSGLSGIAGPA
ncbi:hypothetical protein TSOC_009180, partial [Tetrabaena socialis]